MNDPEMSAAGSTRRPRHRFDSLDSFKEFVGLPALASEPTRIDQQAIDAFATLTNDQQWIHTGAARAAVDSPLKTTIAHGFLTLSLLTSWHFDCFDYSDAEVLLNYGFDKIRFTAPVPSGSLVQAAFRLVKLQHVTDTDVRCFWSVEVRVAGAERPALVAEWLIQMRF